jgi:hypothetical protein
MTQTAKFSPGIGLDVGTSRLVAARKTEQGFRYETQLNAFVNVPFSRVTQGALRKEGIPYIVDDSGIWIHGNDSQRFADLLNTEVRRPMMGGVLNASEPDGVRVISEILKTLTGNAGPTPQNVCFSVPAVPLGTEANLTWHDATLKQMLTEMGYRVKSINEGLAVVYSELEDSNYTGIGISCGGGLCNVCFSYLSVPILSFAVPKAGDFIDASAATVAGARANRVRIIKEDGFKINGHYPNKIHQVLGVYYDDMIRTLVSALNEGFRNATSLPNIGRPIPLVLSGGTSLPQGFKDRFESVLQESRFPVAISEIRLAAEPLSATAKGCLMAAVSEM